MVGQQMRRKEEERPADEAEEMPSYLASYSSSAAGAGGGGRSSSGSGSGICSSSIKALLPPLPPSGLARAGSSSSSSSSSTTSSSGTQRLSALSMLFKTEKSSSTAPAPLEAEMRNGNAHWRSWKVGQDGAEPQQEATGAPSCWGPCSDPCSSSPPPPRRASITSWAPVNRTPSSIHPGGGRSFDGPDPASQQPQRRHSLSLRRIQSDRGMAGMGGLAPAQRLYLEQQRCRVTSTLAFAQASRNVGELTADLPRRRRRPSSYSSSGMREGGDRTASSAGHTTSEELEDHMTFSQQQSKLDERRRRMYCLGCSSAYLGSTPSFASASNTTPPPSDQSWWSEDFSSYHPPSSYDGARAGMGAGDSCSSSSSSSYAVGFPVLQSPEPSEPLSGHLLDGSWVLQERDREPAFFPAKVCLTESLKWQGGPFHECWALPLVVGGSFLPEKCRSKQPLLLPQDVPLPPTPLGGHLPQLQHSAGLCGLDPTRAYRLGDAPVRVLGVGQQSWVLRKLVLWKNVLYELELLPAEAFMMAPPLARQPPLGFVPLSGATVNVLRPGMLRVRAARTCGDDSRSCTVHLCSRDPEDALWWAQLLRAAADLDVDDMYEPVPDDDLRAGRSGLASTPSKVTLSSGKCAVVRRARRRWGCKGRNSGDCAIKVFDKATFFESVRSGGERPDALVREALAQAALTSVVSESSSPIVRLLSAFETRTTLVLEMELMSSQTLLDELTRAGTMDEREAALITRSLLEAVSICQAQGMAHRDVKLSNILLPRDAGASLADCSSTSHPVRLADFGMAGLEDEEGCLRGRCGTPGYVAPEIFALGKQEPYPNGKVDLYSVGVVAYTMIAGYEPFFGETNADIIEQNSAGHVMFHLSSWGKVSLSGQSFVASLLEADPGERMTLAQARQHPWILSAAHVSPVDSDSDSKDDLDETVNLDYHDDELA